MKIEIPDGNEKKPWLTCGTASSSECFMVNGNGTKINMTPKEIVRHKKRTNKSLGISSCISKMYVIDRGDYYTCHCC